MSQPQKTPPASPEKPTAGAEVLHTLYQRALDDKNALQETNEQYCKMLEACAEQNNICERLSQSAKQEADESRKAMEAAVEERNQAVIKLQKVQTQAVVDLEHYKALAAKTALDLQSHLTKAEQRASTNEAKHVEHLSAFREHNAFLEAELHKTTSSWSFVPRLMTNKQNEVRKEYADKMSSVAEALVSTEKKMHHVAEQQARELAQLAKEKDQLANEVADFKLQLVQQQEKTVEIETKAATEVTHLRQEMTVAQEQVRQAQLTASEAMNEKGQVLREAQSSLEQSEAEFLAKLAEINKTASEKERRVFEALQTAMKEFDHSKQEAEKEKQMLTSQLEKAHSELRSNRDELVKVKKELTSAARTKNNALKNLRDTMSEDLSTMEDLLSARTKELRTLQSLFTATVGQEQQRANENRAQIVIPQATVAMENEKLAELTKEVATLQEKLHTVESMHLQADTTLSQQAAGYQAKARELEDLNTVTNQKHEAEITSLQAECDNKVQQLFAQAAQETLRMAEEAKRVMETVDYNAEQVNQAKTVQEELNEALKEIQSLRSQLNFTDDSVPVGSKRKRKA